MNDLLNVFYQRKLIGFVALIMILLEQKGHAFEVKVTEECFAVRFYWKAPWSLEWIYIESSDSLNISLSCDIGSHVRILSLNYSIPNKFDDYCQEDDKKNSQQNYCYKDTLPRCYCCKKPDISTVNGICNLPANDVSDLIGQCKKYRNVCTVTVNAFILKGFCTDIDADYVDKCDENNSWCKSRWATVKYKCIPDNDPATTSDTLNVNTDPYIENTSTNGTNGTLFMTHHYETDEIQDWMIGIITVVVTLIILVAIITAIILCCRKRKDKEKAKAADMELKSVQKSSTRTNSSSQRKADYSVVDKNKKKKKSPSAVKISFHTNNNEKQAKSTLLQDKHSDDTYGKLTNSGKNNSVVNSMENNYYETSLNKTDNRYQDGDVYYATPTSPAVDSSNNEPLTYKQGNGNDEMYASPKSPSIKVVDRYCNQETVVKPECEVNERNSENIYYNTPNSPTNELINNNYYERSSDIDPNSAHCLEEIEYATPNSPPIRLEETNYHKDQDSTYAIPKSPPCEFVENNYYGNEIDGKTDDCVYVNQEFNQKHPPLSDDAPVPKYNSTDLASTNKLCNNQCEEQMADDHIEGNYVYTYGHFKLEGRERKPPN